MFRIPLLVCTLLVSTAGANWAASLDGWQMAGSAPDAYQMEPDTREFHSGESSAHLYSTESSVKGFGTIMQAFDADPYQGERVRLTAWVKAKDVEAWAGLWMRVDEGQRSVGFDNMSSRPITGSQDWTQHSIVLDVTPGADKIALGALLQGPGELWVDDFALEVVSKDTPLTGQKKRRALNLGFDD